jgi:uncharacterized protein (UPF0210 family)
VAGVSEDMIDVVEEEMMAPAVWETELALEVMTARV